MKTRAESANSEDRLVAAAKRGNKVAKNKLIEANRRRVVGIAAKDNSGLGAEEALLEGNLGLVKAVDKIESYNPKRSRFGTYLHGRIHWAILRAADNNRRGLPVHVESTLRDLTRITHQLTQELGHEPSPNEIAPALQDVLRTRTVKMRRIEVTPKKVAHWQLLSQGPELLEDRENDPQNESSWSRNAFARVEREIDIAPIQARVNIVVNDGILTADEKTAIDLVYYREFNHLEAGELLGVPQQTVKSWVHSARRKLRGHPEIQNAHNLLDELNKN